MATNESLRPAVFLDRDGTINRNRPDHVKSLAEFEWLPGALEALQRLARLEWPILVVTNQSVIGRGVMSQETLDEIHESMILRAAQTGGRIDDVLYCPHRPDEGCACRKPGIGLLREASVRWKVDLRRSFLVGDAESDILAAIAGGCQPILVKTGRGKNQLLCLQQHAVDGVVVVEDLREAADWILSCEEGIRYPDQANRPKPETYLTEEGR